MKNSEKEKRSKINIEYVHRYNAGAVFSFLQELIEQ